MIAATKRVLAAALASVCALFSCCGTDEAPDLPEAALSMDPLLEGGASAIRTERCVIVRSGEEWVALWREHAATSLPAPEPPEVDFAERMVVAVFLGERPTAGYRVDVHHCVPNGDAIVVVAAETAPGDDAFQAQVVTAPFAMVTTPRAEGPPVLEVRARSSASRDV